MELTRFVDEAGTGQFEIERRSDGVHQALHDALHHIFLLWGEGGKVKDLLAQRFEASSRRSAVVVTIHILLCIHVRNAYLQR